jgi:hypothetical protein
VGEPLGKQPLAIQRGRWKVFIKRHLREIECEMGGICN